MATAQRATLFDKSGNRVAVDVGSRQASDLFSKGYQLEQSYDPTTKTSIAATGTPNPAQTVLPSSYAKDPAAQNRDFSSISPVGVVGTPGSYLQGSPRSLPSNITGQSNLPVQGPPRPVVQQQPGERQAMINKYLSSGMVGMTPEKAASIVDDLLSKRPAANPATPMSRELTFQPTSDNPTNISTAAPQPAQDPAQGFQAAIQALLAKAQGGQQQGDEDLFAQRNALINARFNATNDLTPEQLRVLAPGQQSALRNMDQRGLEAQLAGVSTALQTREQKRAAEAKARKEALDAEREARKEAREAANNVKVIGSDSSGYYERQSDGSYKQVVGPGGSGTTKTDFQVVDGKTYRVLPDGSLTLALSPEQIAEANAPNAEATAALQQKVNLIDSLLESKGLRGSVGAYGVSRWTPFTADLGDRQDFAAGVNQLVSKETMDSLLNLKAQGGTLGALSDGEKVMLQAAATKIGTWMQRDDKGQPTGKFEVPEETFKAELNLIKSLAQSAINKAVGTATAPTSTAPTYITSDGQQYEQGADGLYYPKAKSGTGAASTNSGAIGGLSSKYESGGNPGAIGYDRTGGYSYGTYQLAHNNAQKFVQQSPYAAQFQGLAFNSPQYRQKWQEVAKKDPQGFANAQHKYIEQTHYAPQIQKLASAGVNVNALSPVLKDVIWSTGVQHGGGTNLVAQAFNSLGKGATDAQLIKKIYELRWNGGKNFGSSTASVRNSVYNRFFGQNGEMNRALAMAQNSRSMA